MVSGYWIILLSGIILISVLKNGELYSYEEQQIYPGRAVCFLCPADCRNIHQQQLSYAAAYRCRILPCTAPVGYEYRWYKPLHYSSLKEAQAENARLTQRIDQLTEENNRLQAEQFELERLRELYQLDQDYMQYEKVAARVIAKDSGNWFQIFRIDKGSADGIKVNMNVMAGGGLVGIVTDVGANYATVRAIIDDDSNVSGMSMRSGDTCNVSGNLTLYQEGRLGLDHIKKDYDIQNGDKIITSNISDIFLPGLLIGYAADLSTDANNVTKSGFIIPVAEFDNLQEVLVITQLKNGGEEDAQSTD